MRNQYQVRINGNEMVLEEARVSAVPLNRRWPGHQREEEQSEFINFLSYTVERPVTFEIIPNESFEKVEIRPKSLGIIPEVTEDGRILFTLEKPCYFTVEPYGRRHALHVFADVPKTYDVDLEDENVIYYGPGEHEVGQIELKSNQTLFIDEGAVVYSCIKAYDAENIRIIGKGILDNSHNKEQILFEASAGAKHQAVKNAVRQHTIQLEYCTNVEIDGIIIRDSLVYNVRPVACKNLHIANIKIIGCWRYNSDGIDMHNCEDVLIEDCFIRTFDDSICIKGFDCYYEGDIEKVVREAMYRNGKSYDVFKNVRVRNCVIWNDWGRCLEIGAETRAEEMCNITFEDCDIIHVMHAVLDCQNVDYADVHDVTYRNINIEYDDEIPAPLYQETNDMVYYNKNPEYTPPVICAQVKFHHEYSAGGTRRGKNHNILFENIRLYGRQKPAFSFSGYDEDYKTKDIEIRNFYWNDKPIGAGDYTMSADEFCENIRITYASSDK